MTYDDGRVACTYDALVIRRYYFPFGDKRIPYAGIRRALRIPLTTIYGRHIWGSGDLVHWFNYDPRRLHKRDALVIFLKGRVRPVITPDNADDVTAELASHGVNVTTG